MSTSEMPKVQKVDEYNAGRKFLSFALTQRNITISMKYYNKK